MTEKPTFEQLLNTLEEAVERLEQGQLPLDEALACFEKGVQSAIACRAQLQDVEGRVETLLSQSDGTFRTEAFDGADD